MSSDQVPAVERQILKLLVLVDHAEGISGPHRNVVGSLNALGRRDDIQVRLLCSRIDPAEPYAGAKNIEILNGYWPHDVNAVFRNIARVSSAARGCELIYVPSGLKSLLYAQAGRFGKPIVAGPNVSPLPFTKSDSPGPIELRLLSNQWIENSANRRDFVVQKTGHTAVRIVLHGIDLDKWSPDKRNPAIWNEFGVPAGGLKLLYVGGGDATRKGVAQLIDAFELIRKQSPSDDLQLVLAGKISEKSIERLRRIGCAYCLGFVRSEQLAALYASADISIVPSSWESFGFTVLEAMASGLAVIGGRAGGIKEQIVHGESGILIDITDDEVIHRPDAGERIASAVRMLAADTALRERLGRAARQRALTHFSELRLGAELTDIFRDVCNRPRALAAAGTPTA